MSFIPLYAWTLHSYFTSVPSVSLQKTKPSKYSVLYVSISFQNFLRDLLKEAKKINDVSEDKLIEYTDTMVTIKFIIIFLISRQNVSDRMHLLKSVLTRAENRSRREQMPSTSTWLQCCVKYLSVVSKALPDNKACRHYKRHIFRHPAL
jgi:hypothetical protein